MLTLKSANDIREFVKQNIGKSNEASMFADSFIKQRKLDEFNPPVEISKPQKQSIVNEQQISTSSGKKQKSKVKLDPSLLGFSVSSNRIMQGEIDTPDN